MSPGGVGAVNRQPGATCLVYPGRGRAAKEVAGTAKGLHVCRMSDTCLPRTRIALSKETLKKFLHSAKVKRNGKWGTNAFLMCE